MNGKPIVIAALVALAACGQRGGEAGRDSQRNPPPANPANVSISTPQGQVDVRAGAGAAADMPEGIPVYPGAAAAQGVSVSGAAAGDSGQILGFTTPDPPDRVLGFYADAARRAGYSITQQMSAGQTAMLIAARDGRILNVTATRIGAVTQIQIIAGLGQ